MPPLTNLKHEDFAKKFASGIPASKAYEEIYGQKSPAVAASLGSRLLKSAKVATRVAELQEKGAAGTVMSLQYKRELLKNFMETPPSKIDEHSIYADAVEYEFFGKGKNRKRKAVKIRSMSRLRALELDAKLAGELRESVDVNHSGQIEHKAIVVHIPAAIAEPRKVKEIQPPRSE